MKARCCQSEDHPSQRFLFIACAIHRVPSKAGILCLCFGHEALIIPCYGLVKSETTLALLLRTNPSAEARGKASRRPLSSSFYSYREQGLSFLRVADACRSQAPSEVRRHCIHHPAYPDDPLGVSPWSRPGKGTMIFRVTRDCSHNPCEYRHPLEACPHQSTTPLRACSLPYMPSSSRSRSTASAGKARGT